MTQGIVLAEGALSSARQFEIEAIDVDLDTVEACHAQSANRVIDCQEVVSLLFGALAPDPEDAILMTSRSGAESDLMQIYVSPAVMGHIPFEQFDRRCRLE